MLHLWGSYGVQLKDFHVKTVFPILDLVVCSFLCNVVYG